MCASPVFTERSRNGWPVSTARHRVQPLDVRGNDRRVEGGLPRGTRNNVRIVQSGCGQHQGHSERGPPGSPSTTAVWRLGGYTGGLLSLGADDAARPARPGPEGRGHSPGGSWPMPDPRPLGVPTNPCKPVFNEQPRRPAATSGRARSSRRLPSLVEGYRFVRRQVPLRLMIGECP